MYRETHDRISASVYTIRSVLLMTCIPPPYSVLVSKSSCFITVVTIIFMGTVESSLLFSSVKWIQTEALGGNTFYAAHIGKEIYNSLQSPVSHTQHLYLPTIISSTSQLSLLSFCLHLAFHPHSTCFIINIFFFSLWNQNSLDVSAKAQEDTKQGLISLLNQKNPMVNIDVYSKQMSVSVSMHAY